MSKKLEKKLSEEHRHELETVSKTTRDSKLFRRIKVILYQDEGYSIRAIRKHTRYSEGGAGAARQAPEWASSSASEAETETEAH